MKPGATISPVASNISASGAEIPAPILSMRSPASSTSCVESPPVMGSRTRPFFMSNIRSVLGRIFCPVFGRRTFHGRAADEVIKQGHANREAIRYLVENTGLRTIGDCSIDFETTNHGTRMQNQRLRTG